MNRHHSIWTETDKQTLTKLYKIGNTDHEIATMLGRTQAAVLVQRNRMDLHRPKGRPKQQPVRKSATYTRKRTISLLWGLIKIYS